MPEQVLARKWRPRAFGEVMGQEHVIKALVNALSRQRLHHAYLFAGTRGIGKTTIARIVAKSLNCEKGISADPCGQCSACTEIDQGIFVDFLEVDAASRTKVEDTRDLLENVKYFPTKGRFKIYLIDEVHMLSGHSFNALLKTLEEPPAHVKFLLATTDPQKLPATVLSRCLQFNLKNVPSQLIQKQLSLVLTKENIPFEEEALRYLARAAEGSIRDGLSLLDQAISYGGGKVLVAEIKTMLGAIEKDQVLRALLALADHNGEQLLDLAEELSSLGIDLLVFLTELLATLQQISVAQISLKTLSLVEHKDELEKLSQRFSAEDLQLYYQIGVLGKRDWGLMPNAKSALEMIFLRMLAFCPLEAVTTKDPIKIVTTSIPQNVTKLEPVVLAGSQNGDLLERLNLSGPTGALIKHCVVNEIKDGTVILSLDKKQAPFLHQNHEKRLSEALSQHFKKPMRVIINLEDGDLNTTAKKEQEKIEKNTVLAKQAIAEDQWVKTMVNDFQAEIIPEALEIISEES
jgi:DNA polymerase III subunit gamma/tau